MANSLFKDIVAYIRKRAEKPPKPASIAPDVKPVPGIGKSPVGLRADTSIKQMQVTMQKLAQAVSTSINYDMLNKSMQSPNASPDDRKQLQSQYGKDLFSNFMVNRYLRTSNVKDVELDPKPADMTSDLKYMTTVLNNIHLLSQATSFADGTWGRKTNNALKNVYAIADSIMRLGQDLGMQSKSFDAGKISELQNLIPNKDTDISISEKEKRSVTITEILNGIIALLADFKQQVQQHPTYQALIKGEPLLTVSPQKTAPEMAGGEKAVYNDLLTNPRNYLQNAYRFNVSLPKEYVPQQYANVIKPFQITGVDLLTPQAFDKWLGGNTVLMSIKEHNPESFNNVVKIMLDQVKQQISQKITPSGPGY